MSRINTNVSSLVAQKTLTRSNSQLQESLTRLSTGLRINSGKDDPAGLIASENLRRDITSINRAITNSERANQLIGTADSALGQISNLLNDIRGLVVEAANTGVLSDDQVAANQLQVDSSLEAIDRISQVTTFQGRKLLDGSLDFQITYSAGEISVRDLEIQQANLGATGSVDVDVLIATAATQALITNNGFDPSDSVQATGTLSLTGGEIDVSAVSGSAADGTVGNATDIVLQAAANIVQAGTGGTPLALTNSAGGLNISAVADGAADGIIGNGTDIVFQAATGITQSGNNFAFDNGGSFTITSVTNTAASGAVGNTLTLDIQWGAGATSANYNSGTNTLTIVANNGGATTLADIATEVGNLAEFNVSAVTNGASLIAATDDETINNALTGGNSGTLSASYSSGTNTITVNVAAQSTVTQVAAAIAAINSGADFTASASSGGSNRFDTGDFATVSNPLSGGSDGTTTAVYASGVITVDVAIGATIGNVATAINGLAAFNATATTGSGATFDTGDFGTILGTLDGGVDAGLSDVLGADLVLKVAGATGAEVFTFEAGATLDQIANAVNLVNDATGVQAATNGGTLELRANEYGSAGFVDVEVLEEGAGGGFTAGLSDTRVQGTDVVATVNGVTANGRGNTLSINTSTLDLTLKVSDGSSTDVSFTINGGGAVFQLGPQVVSNQQARVGIGSVNTGELGGVDGRLYQLRSGNDSDLAGDPNNATLIVDAAINKVTSLRGRLGAFQRTTLETNIASLSDTVTNLVDAESSIRDADFAAESAKLTRAQILVQSGTQVLAIANQNPQNVLALLRG